MNDKEFWLKALELCLKYDKTPKQLNKIIGELMKENLEDD